MKSKILSLYCLLLLIIFSSCSSDSIIDPGIEIPVNHLSGNISNWPSQSLIVRAEIFNNSTSSVVGIDTVFANGQFNMILQTPPSVALIPVRSFIFSDTALTISDTNAFVGYVSSLSVYDVTNSVIGWVQRINYESIIIPGSFIVRYIYIDRNTSISGTSVFSNFADTTRSNINLHFVTGWNKFYLRLVSRSSTLTVYEVNNGEPAGGYWYYTPFYMVDYSRQFTFGIKPD